MRLASCDCARPQSAIKEAKSMTSRVFRLLFAAKLSVSTLFLAGCENTMPEGIQEARSKTAAAIAAETTGDYFIGRRYYKIPQYKFWGYVSHPDEQWHV